MRILQIARQFYPSMAGVERFTMDLCQHLLRRGIHSDVLTLNRCFYLPGILPAEDQVEGVRVLRIPYWGGQRFFLAPAVLRFTSGYDVLHVHNVDFFADFLILAKPCHRKPVIVSTHGGFFHTRRLALLKQVYFNTVTRLLLRRADRVIASGIQDHALFAPLAPSVMLIENGVAVGCLSQVRKKIDPGLLLYVGRLVSNKRVDSLIRALTLLRQQVPHARLALVGCDFEGVTARLRALAEEQGVAEAVFFVGQVSDAALVEWLTRAHLFVSASEYEGFGISVLEAMVTGTVPVVNDIPAFRHFIHDGDNGFLVDFSRPEQAAQTLARALESDPGALAACGARARAAAARYDWEAVVDRFVDVYKEAAK